MKSLAKLFCLLSLSFLLTGCFEVFEEVKMNNDGSGNVIWTINGSQSKENLKNYMNMDEVQGVKIPKSADIDREIARMKQVLKTVKGISNVQTSTDYEEFILKISGDFANAKALNIAINTVADAMNRSPYETIKKDNFAFAKNTFSRLFEYPIKKDIYKKLDFGTRFVLETAQLTSIYRFDKKIKKTNNAKAEISPSGKSVMLKSNLSGFVKGEVNLANDISFSKN